MADTPSWLSEDAPSSTLAPAPAPSAPSPLEISGNNAAGSMLKSSKAVKAAAASSSAAVSSAPVDESDLPNIILVMRLANLGSVTALVVVSVSGPCHCEILSSFLLIEVCIHLHKLQKVFIVILSIFDYILTRFFSSFD